MEQITLLLSLFLTYLVGKALAELMIPANYHILRGYPIIYWTKNQSKKIAWKYEHNI
ncbi:hypothetical protein DB41_EG00040 [Neochlamydia sp. TUME1]|nr:hypothetical protein DB41_EG00040 [Neochlamydia sp. TUME1]